jgi:glyoxylase-like metal-dependent hydrolase (beta-lactamase superfamily II)
MPPSSNGPPTSSTSSTPEAAKRIIAVCPFYGYARQDKKALSREPITAKLLADMLTVAGASRVVYKPVPHIYQRFPAVRMTLPEIVFDNTTTLTLPGVSLDIKYCAENGHSHSKGDTTLYFTEEEVLIAGDLLYTEVHPVTFFGNIPNWLTTLKPLFQTRYKRLLPGHGPAVEGQQAGQAYFKKMHDYLEDFYGKLQEIKAGRKNAREVAEYMMTGAYASLGKTRMVERNINQFLTGRWY